jgi:peptidoglycan/xylan/chitin deacetylase (PgdA/CDA1 family)
VYLGREYLEAGWTAEDNFDGDMTEKVKAEGEVDIHTPGKYTITYTLTDTFGNSTSAKRVVTVEPVPEPEIVVPGEKVIYLTFDDGPGPHTPRLLEILKKYDVKATFFVVNTKYADLISDIVADGHAIGVHTASHIYRDIYASEEAFFADFKTIHDLIYEKSEVKTTLMRFPGGSSNRVSASYNEGIMTRLTKIVTDYGLQYFDWNVNSLDAGGAGTAEQVYQNVISSVRQNPYSVVLQHDIHGFSVDAVERIIQWGLANGYTFLPLEPTSPGCHQKILN